MTHTDDTSPAAMAAAREGGETIASIVRRTGLSPSTVRRRAQAGGFVAKTRTHWDGRDPILRRLVSALNRKMKIVEARIAASEGISRMDSERDARTLGGLARLYERLINIAGRMRSKAARGKAAGNDDETERLRRELAERLARLRGRGS